MLPASRPQMKEDDVRALLSEKGLPSLADSVVLLAIRGYYKDSMGKVGVNDVGIYDDAMFVVGPNVFAAFNANTDPSRLGWNEGVGKPFAVLQKGLWYFRRGQHKKQLKALRQCTDEEAESRNIPDDGEFLVERSRGEGDARNYKEKGYFAINIHAGGNNGTSSWGCQTLPPDQFVEFIDLVYSETLKHQQTRIPYLLC